MGKLVQDYFYSVFVINKDVLGIWHQFVEVNDETDVKGDLKTFHLLYSNCTTPCALVKFAKKTQHSGTEGSSNSQAEKQHVIHGRAEVLGEGLLY